MSRSISKFVNCAAAMVAINFAPSVVAPALAQEAPEDVLIIAQGGETEAMPGPSMEEGLSLAISALPALLGAPPVESARLGGGPRFGHILTGENAISDDQWERMHNLRNAMLDKYGPRMAELSSLNRQMRDALGSASIDSKKVNDLRNRISAAKTDLTNYKLDHMIAMAEVFTPAQRAELHRAMIKGPMEMMGRRPHMMGRGFFDAAKGCPVLPPGMMGGPGACPVKGVK